MNPGATYYAEVQYDSPHEYAWCQAHAGQCNMYNNASYRQYGAHVGTTSFTFSSIGSTVRMAPATSAWTGATFEQGRTRSRQRRDLVYGLQSDQPKCRGVALRIRSI